MIALLYFALLVLAFFVLVVRPRRREIAAHRALVAALEVSDEIVTTGGVYGTIKALDDAVMQLEISDGVVVRVARSAVARRVVPEDEAGGEASADEPADGTTA